MESYRDLKVWQLGMDIGAVCYMVTKSFPKDEMFGFTSQIRRASVSIPANITEGYGRQSNPAFVQFLRVAQGSLKELETHLLLAVRVEIVNQSNVDPILAQCDQEGRMILALIKSVTEQRR